MDSYMYPAYNPYSYRYLTPKNKGMSWRQKNYLASYGDTGDYYDNYQRAQLKAILSQVNPNLTPRLRKANTRDVGVQVNPRQDASVQCSLGPRTLLRRRPGAFRKPQQTPSEQGSPASPTKTVRFPRTVAVYSPVAAGRLAPFQDRGENLAEKAEGEAMRSKDSRGEGGRPEGKQGDGGISETKMDKADKEEAAPGQTRPKFQFLEQKYGYYHCKDCNIRWESAYVWCVQGTNKVYFKQFCRTCQKSYNPYRVEDIMCQSCKQTRCMCPVKLRHVDPKRPHRQDLCGRCKGKRLSCDSTFSFKYII
ncbi:zygote arrest protein 1 [Xenopus tropicalis]|nr:zygote arrest protein 1 [Xenopus tropicalis]CAJ81525.1 zygote arrest 1 [Xenopus tropicalis]|eukprot:NP_001016947.2 zygote arrest protein 1 [Xenopus tropicalis]